MRRCARKLSIYLSLLSVATLVLSPAAVQAATGTGDTRATTPSERGEDPFAWAARELNLQETGRLHSVGEPGTTFLERGSATGTFNCSIAGRLTIVSANKVIATFTVRPKGGSITGRGSARFQQQGASGYFGGTISITNGTGSYAHASGTNLGISGVISRETFALTVHVHGKIHV